MLVSHSKKFIYTKTVKTAGTSVEVYFEPHCMFPGEYEFAHLREEYVSDAGIIGYRGYDCSGKKWFNHMSAVTLMAQLDKEIWDQYFKFCVIRNPFERYVSAFYFFSSMGKITSPEDSGFTDDIEKFRWWMGQDGIIESIVDRDKYTIDNEVCVDFIIRHDRLLEDLKVVCEKLDIVYSPEKVRQLKSGLKPRAINIGNFYDSSLVDTISEIYSYEINTFGYCPDGTRS